MAQVIAKKYLPLVLRSTRWGELVDVTQNVLNQIQTETYDRIRYKFDFDEISDDECKYLISLFGYTLSTYTGYTNTTEYFKKHLLSLVPRIQSKNNRASYTKLLSVYNFTGDVQPSYSSDGIQIIPIYDWWTSEETPSTVTELDPEVDNIAYQVFSSFDSGGIFDDNGFFDTKINVLGSTEITSFTAQYLDSDNTNFATLDQVDEISSLTRAIIFNYTPNYVENEDEFYSLETMRAFYNDTMWNKRKTEQIYFEPELKLQARYETDSENTICKNYTDSLGTLSAQERALTISGDFKDVITVKVGDGENTDFENTTDMVSTTHTITVDTDMTIVEQTADIFNAEYTITEYDKTFSKITEIGFFDSSDELLYYWYFPAINYDARMYNSLLLNVSRFETTNLLSAYPDDWTTENPTSKLTSDASLPSGLPDTVCFETGSYIDTLEYSALVNYEKELIVLENEIMQFHTYIYMPEDLINTGEDSGSVRIKMINSETIIKEKDISTLTAGWNEINYFYKAGSSYTFSSIRFEDRGFDLLSSESIANRTIYCVNPKFYIYDTSGVVKTYS